MINQKLTFGFEQNIWFCSVKRILLIRFICAVCDFRPLDSMPFHRIFVPTADVVCYSFLLGALVRNKVNALLAGSRGCGKTSCIRRAVLDDLADVYTTLTVPFSSQTSSNEAQEVHNF